MTLIEVVTAMAIFAVVSGGLISLLLSTMGTSTLARQRTLAQQAASTQIEQIRNLPYASIGNISGNPPGTIQMTSSITIGGPTATTSATRTTKISYVNDPTPLSYQSYANYKQVSVTITRSSDGLQLAREVTNIAPPVKASQSQATVVVTVVDSGNNAAVPNAQVNIANGPSGAESDTSDTSGKVTFAGLLPTSISQPDYDVTVTPPAGYVALKDTQPPATVAHFGLAPGQTQPAAIQIYQPATVIVQLLNSDGTSYVGASNVTVSSTRGSQTFAYTSPQLAVTAINGEPLVPGSQLHGVGLGVRLHRQSRLGHGSRELPDDAQLDVRLHAPPDGVAHRRRAENSDDPLQQRDGHGHRRPVEPRRCHRPDGEDRRHRHGDVHEPRPGRARLCDRRRLRERQERLVVDHVDRRRLRTPPRRSR